MHFGGGWHAIELLSMSRSTQVVLPHPEGPLRTIVKGCRKKTRIPDEERDERERELDVVVAIISEEAGVK